MLGLSVWSVSIILERKKFYRDQKSGSDAKKIRELIAGQKWSELLSFTSGKTDLISTSMHQLASAKSKNIGQKAEYFDRIFRSHVSANKTKMEKSFANLATLGANAPFIGLFGTVLGIIQAFAALGFESTGTGAVMSGISRSLVATAAGLFVAIPAVVAFNYFSKTLKELYAENDSLKDLFISNILD